MNDEMNERANDCIDPSGFTASDPIRDLPFYAPLPVFTAHQSMSKRINKRMNQSMRP